MSVTSKALPVCLAAIALLFPIPSGAEEPALPDNPLKGRLLFESKKCVECHGLAGSSTEEIGPRLDEGSFRGTFLDLGAALWNHVPGMSVGFADAGLPWPRLSDREVSELTAFLYFIDYLGRPGNAEVGKRLYSDKGCSLCHRTGAGTGTGTGPDLSGHEKFATPLYIAQSIWNHGPAMLGSMRERGIPPPRFEEGDLSDLSAYLRQLGRAGPQQRVLLTPGNPNRGRELFSTKGCAVCHEAGNTRRSGAPDLERSDLHRSAEAIAGTMWNHAGPMSETMREAELQWPSFTTAELADLVAYIYFLPFTDPAGDPDRGAAVFSDRSCAGCHGGGDGSAPDLSATRAAGSAADLVAAMWNHAPLMREAILGEGLPWPELTGEELRDLRAFLARAPAAAAARPSR